MNLWIVVPVHNRLRYTSDFLAALRSQSDSGFTVLVVDDGSSDGTREMLRSQRDWVRTVQGGGTLWWSGAVNLGVEHALAHDATHVVLLNDDTLPAQNLVEVLKKDSRGHPGALLGCLTIDAGTGLVDDAGGLLCWWTGGTRSLRLADRSPAAYTGLRAATHLSGRGLLIPRKVFERIGLFDAQGLPQGAADYDFALRAARTGFAVFCDWDARVVSFPQASGASRLMRQRSWANYRSHLFDIRGAGNLSHFCRLAVRNCPGWLLPVALVTGLARRVLGYPARWLLESMRRGTHA